MREHEHTLACTLLDQRVARILGTVKPTRAHRYRSEALSSLQQKFAELGQKLFTYWPEVSNVSPNSVV